MDSQNHFWIQAKRKGIIPHIKMWAITKLHIHNKIYGKLCYLKYCSEFNLRCYTTYGAVAYINQSITVGTINVKFSSNKILYYYIFRCSLMGFDLNRHWQDPSAWAHPTLYGVKQLIVQMYDNPVSNNNEKLVIVSSRQNRRCNL